MKNLMLVLAAFSACTSLSALAHDHSDHLWSSDRKAYRSYRETPKPFSLSDLEPQQSHIGSTWPSTRAPAPNPGPAPAPRDPNRVSTIDTKVLVDNLTILSGEKDPVLANRGKQNGRLAAREFLRKEFEALGYAVSDQAYGSGTNLIAERAGKSGKFLIVSAHYDSVNNAGADDDGTGVVTMLATAKLLSDKVLKDGVRFVAFDEEELGLVGSKAYVKALVAKGEKAKIIGNLQMEMMGYNSRGDGKFHAITCDRPDSQFLANAFTAVVARLGSGLEITKACTDRSDHASFWKQNIPAIVISENFFGGDDNPCYHQSCDKMNRMHIDYFERVAEASANAVAELIAE